MSASEALTQKRLFNRQKLEVSESKGRELTWGLLEVPFARDYHEIHSPTPKVYKGSAVPT